MRWVLEGLNGVIDVEMDLGRDAFTINYYPSRVSVDNIKDGIRLLGFRPELSEPDDLPTDTDREHESKIPAAVATALAEAKTSGRFVLVDFFAGWCRPCLTLEKDVLGDPRIIKAFDRFLLIKIDTDKDLESAQHFRILALPTPIVIDTEGMELFRHEGMIGVDRLAQELGALAHEINATDRKNK